MTLLILINAKVRKLQPSSLYNSNILYKTFFNFVSQGNYCHSLFHVWYFEYNLLENNNELFKVRTLSKFFEDIKNLRKDNFFPIA